MTKLPSTYVKSIEVDGLHISRGNIAGDPLKLKVRLYIQIGELLRQLETGETGDGEVVTIRERTGALTAIGRLQMVLIDKGKDDDDIAGSAVRKYEGAFKNGPGKRKKITRPSARELELESDGDGGDSADAD